QRQQAAQTFCALRGYFGLGQLVGRHYGKPSANVLLYAHRQYIYTKDLLTGKMAFRQVINPDRSCPLRVIHVIPAIAACPVLPERTFGQWRVYEYTAYGG